MKKFTAVVLMVLTVLMWSAARGEVLFELPDTPQTVVCDQQCLEQGGSLVLGRMVEVGDYVPFTIDFNTGATIPIFSPMYGTYVGFGVMVPPMAEPVDVYVAFQLSDGNLYVVTPKGTEVCGSGGCYLNGKKMDRILPFVSSTQGGVYDLGTTNAEGLYDVVNGGGKVYVLVQPAGVPLASSTYLLEVVDVKDLWRHMKKHKEEMLKPVWWDENEFDKEFEQAINSADDEEDCDGDECEVDVTNVILKYSGINWEVTAIKKPEKREDIAKVVPPSIEKLVPVLEQIGFKPVSE
ncbi:MAG: hypothetical protein GXO44_01695 [Deferribacteres bacterium]|nr:hypothetical protein [Deferribacteres bacterium]